ncbi:MAG: hypothetical protein RLZ64_1159, partial [Pseudomonadota bacterium]
MGLLSLCVIGRGMLGIKVCLLAGLCGSI